MFHFIRGKMDLIYYLYYFYWVTITISNRDKFQRISVLVFTIISVLILHNLDVKL